MKTLAMLAALLLVVAACSESTASPSAGSAAPSGSARPTSTPATASADPTGGLTVVECDPATDQDCQVAGLRVIQPVPAGEQIRLSVRLRNGGDSDAGPVTIIVRDSAGEADLGKVLPIAGCSKPCQFETSEDGLELRAEWQAPIEAGKALTLTLVLNAKEPADHLLDVSIFASPMADIADPLDDPTKLAEWLAIVATVEEG